MMWRQGNLKFSTLLVILFSTLCAGAFAQQAGTGVDAAAKLLELKIPEFEMRNETLLDGIWKLARIPVPFGFGFESVLKGSSGDPEIADPRFSFVLKGRSAREILDALCEADSRYIWSPDGDTINVFPKDTAKSPTYLLNRRLDKFELREATDVDDGLLAIARQLPPPPEQIAHVQLNGNLTYPREPWTVTYQNVSVRQVVNRLAEHGGSCSVWTFGGSKDFRRFAFFNNLRYPKQTPDWMRQIIESRPKSEQP